MQFHTCPVMTDATLILCVSSFFHKCLRLNRNDYMQKIKSIESDLEGARTASAPKAKFAFKRKTVAKPTASPPISSPSSSAAPSTSATPANALPTSGLSISGHSHKYLSVSSLSSPWSSASDLTISDLDHCVVNLTPADANPDYPQGSAFTALHVKNLSNTILVLPVITGSALLHDIKNCVIALGSRQVCSLLCILVICMRCTFAMAICPGQRRNGRRTFISLTAQDQFPATKVIQRA